MRTKFEIRTADLKGIFIDFHTEYDAIRYWSENIENAGPDDFRHGAVVVRHTRETHQEAETARLDFLLGEEGIARFSRECLREDLANADPKDWLKTARAAIDIARKSPPETATVIWPKSAPARH